MEEEYKENMTIKASIFSKLKNTGAIFINSSELCMFSAVGCLFYDCMNTISSGGSIAIYSDSIIVIDSNCFTMCRTSLHGSNNDFGQAYLAKGTKHLQSTHSTVFLCPEKNDYNHSPIAAFCPNGIIQSANVSSNDCYEGGCACNYDNNLITVYHNSYLNNTSNFNGHIRAVRGNINAKECNFVSQRGSAGLVHTYEGIIEIFGCIFYDNAFVIESSYLNSGGKSNLPTINLQHLRLYACDANNAVEVTFNMNICSVLGSSIIDFSKLVIISLGCIHSSKE